jgi:hypothetical protein
VQATKEGFHEKKAIEEPAYGRIMSKLEDAWGKICNLMGGGELSYQ